ncbi:MAG: putative glycoside hydrolase [Patescibacteria group bacterium]
MKKHLIFLLLILAGNSYGQKMSVHWYLPTLDAIQAMNIAKYDLIVLDYENKFNNSESIDLIIERNSNAKILYYWNYVEWFRPMFPDKPWSIKMLAELEKRPGYWLKQTDKKPLVFWSGMEMMNITDYCPKIKGENYREFITKHLLKDIISDPRCQGIFLDNIWATLDWLGKYGKNESIDANGDGKMDSPAELNASYLREARQFIAEIRKAKGKNFIIITNPINATLLDLVDGKNMENFPDLYLGSTKNGGWDINMTYADNGKRYNIFNARADNLFFTICSAMLLDDVYVSFQQNTFWKDEYQLNLGKALGKKESEAGSQTIQKREYENGTVIVNATLGKAKIKYRNGTVRSSFQLETDSASIK